METRGTLRNGIIGGVVGVALGFVPLVVLVAPLLGGGIAGYLERKGWKQGALAGGIAGVLMAAISSVITGVIFFLRFGDLPFGTESFLASLGIATFLTLVATVGQVIVASIGGALGALLAEGRTAPGPATLAVGEGPAERRRRRRWAVVLGSLTVGIVTFLVIALALTAVLDPLIWPSALVGLPIGFIVGAAVAVLAFRYFTRGPDSTVNWRGVGIGAMAVLIVFALVLGGLYVLGQQGLERSYQSTYEYRVTMSTDRTLENPTFYVPVPQVGNESRLGDRFVQDVEYYRDEPAIVGYDPEPAPVNFTYDLVETEHGRMLAISADRIEVSRVYYREVENETMGWRERIEPEEYDPSDPSMGVVTDGHFSFGVTMVADDPIETADPFGTEPLLDPVYDRTQVECTFGLTEVHRCYEYESRVYVSYDADANTTVSLSSELTGRNEWFSGGWTGNEYRQWTHTELLGPGTGWYEMKGELDVGNGRYRD